LPARAETLDPGTTDGAIKTFGMGLSSCHRKKIVTSPLAYAGELSKAPECPRICVSAGDTVIVHVLVVGRRDHEESRQVSIVHICDTPRY
jgi:hypothetical protein